MNPIIITDDGLENYVVNRVRSIGKRVPFHFLVADLQETLGVDFSGAYNLVSPDDPDIVVWPDLDAVLVDAISSAVRKQRLHLVPALARQYANTGCDLRGYGYVVPQSVEQGRDGGGPYWLPMTLSA